MLRVVFDSNVYISALLFDGPPRQIFELALKRQVILITSDDIINETARILRSKFSWPEHRVQQFVRQSAKLAVITNPKKKLSIISDENDNRVLECAVEGSAHIIISGDKDLLRLKEYNGIPIKNPKYLTYLIRSEA